MCVQPHAVAVRRPAPLRAHGCTHTRLPHTPSEYIEETRAMTYQQESQDDRRAWPESWPCREVSTLLVDKLRPSCIDPRSLVSAGVRRRPGLSRTFAIASHRIVSHAPRGAVVCLDRPPRHGSLPPPPCPGHQGTPPDQTRGWRQSLFSSPSSVAISRLHTTPKATAAAANPI